MRNFEILDMKGKLTLQKRDKNGQIIEEIQANNSIVLTGRDLVAKLFIKETISPISHVAIGTGTKEVDPANDKKLENEAFRKVINTVDPTQHLTTTPDNKKKVTITADLDFSDANAALTEAGLFNAATDGIMYNRVKFPAINKTEDFKLTLIWEIIF